MLQEQINFLKTNKTTVHIIFFMESISKEIYLSWFADLFVELSEKK